jgi:hypothetical protein
MRHVTMPLGKGGGANPGLKGVFVAPPSDDQPGQLVIGRPQQLEALKSLGVINGSCSFGESTGKLVAAIGRDGDGIDADDGHEPIMAHLGGSDRRAHALSMISRAWAIAGGRDDCHFADKGNAYARIAAKASVNRPFSEINSRRRWSGPLTMETIAIPDNLHGKGSFLSEGAPSWHLAIAIATFRSDSVDPGAHGCLALNLRSSEERTSIRRVRKVTR